MRMLGPHLGELTSSTLALAGNGYERRVFSYRSNEGLLHLMATMARRTGGETWYLALRRVPEDAVPVAIRGPGGPVSG